MALALKLKESGKPNLCLEIEDLAEKLRSAAKAKTKVQITEMGNESEDTLKEAGAIGRGLADALRTNGHDEDATEVQRISSMLQQVIRGEFDMTELDGALRDAKIEVCKLREMGLNEEADTLQGMVTVMETARAKQLAASMLRAKYRTSMAVEKMTAEAQDEDEPSDFDSEEDDDDCKDTEEEVKMLSSKLRNAGKVEETQDVEKMIAELEAARRAKYLQKLSKTREKMEAERAGALESAETVAIALRKAKAKKEAGDLTRIIEEVKNAKKGDEFLTAAKKAYDFSLVLRDKGMVAEAEQMLNMAKDVTDAVILEIDVNQMTKSEEQHDNIVSAGTAALVLATDLTASGFKESGAAMQGILDHCQSFGDDDVTVKELDLVIMDCDTEMAKLRTHSEYLPQLKTVKDKLVAAREADQNVAALGRKGQYLRARQDTLQKMEETAKALAEVVKKMIKAGLDTEADRLDQLRKRFVSMRIENHEIETDSLHFRDLARSLKKAEKAEESKQVDEA